jgi:hypothetical protein
MHLNPMGEVSGPRARRKLKGVTRNSSIWMAGPSTYAFVIIEVSRELGVVRRWAGRP